MEKKDIMYVVAALGIILVIAIVIKPLATGQPVNTGISLPATTPIVTQKPAHVYTETTPPSIPRTTTVPPTKTPTPVPTWDSKTKTVGFVDPATYGISINESIPSGTRIDSTIVNKTTTSYAKISGQYSGTTQVISIPFPYWELWYTVEPAGQTGGKGQTLSKASTTGSKESGVKGGTENVIQGSFSFSFPTFTLQVMDAEDPNRIVRTITPPGGIDKGLWTSGESGDPRPWKEIFYEGGRKYYFIIYSHALSSYSLDIRVPTEYIGKY